MGNNFNPFDLKKRINEILTGEFIKPVDGGSPAPAENAKNTEEKSAETSTVSIEGQNPYKKYDANATRKKATSALFRSTTGIGLSDKVKGLLSGSMKEAALKIIKDPSLVNTEAGGILMSQLMSNVKGFNELG